MAILVELFLSPSGFEETDHFPSVEKREGGRRAGLPVRHIIFATETRTSGEPSQPWLSQGRPLRSETVSVFGMDYAEARCLKQYTDTIYRARFYRFECNIM
jgi:hypothetical protein